MIVFFVYEVSSDPCHLSVGDSIPPKAEARQSWQASLRFMEVKFVDIERVDRD